MISNPPLKIRHYFPVCFRVMFLLGFKTLQLVQENIEIVFDLFLIILNSLIFKMFLDPELWITS